MLFLVGFIIFFAWIFIRKRDKRIEVLEEVNDELEDEITVLERAKQQAMAAKKWTKKAPTKKTEPTTTAKEKTTAPRKTTASTKKVPTRKPRAKKAPTDTDNSAE